MLHDQHKIDGALDMLNDTIKDLNSYDNMETPWTSDPPYGRRKNAHFVLQSHKLKDGVHLYHFYTEEVIKQIIKYTHRHFGLSAPTFAWNKYDKPNDPNSSCNTTAFLSKEDLLSYQSEINKNLITVPIVDDGLNVNLDATVNYPKKSTEPAYKSTELRHLYHYVGRDTKKLFNTNSGRCTYFSQPTYQSYYGSNRVNQEDYHQPSNSGYHYSANNGHFNYSHDSYNTYGDNNQGYYSEYCSSRYGVNYHSNYNGQNNSRYSDNSHGRYGGHHGSKYSDSYHGKYQDTHSSLEYNNQNYNDYSTNYGHTKHTGNNNYKRYGRHKTSPYLRHIPCTKRSVVITLNLSYYFIFRLSLLFPLVILYLCVYLFLPSMYSRHENPVVVSSLNNFKIVMLYLPNNE